MNKALTPKSIFLLDGIGAVVSFLSLGVLLPAFQSYIGMPLKVLYPLAALALCFAVYSLSCYRLVDHENPMWLRIIIGANLSYCLISLACIVMFYEQLTKLGLTYFLAEKLIVLGIVYLEATILKTVSK